MEAKPPHLAQAHLTLWSSTFFPLVCRSLLRVIPQTKSDFMLPRVHDWLSSKPLAPAFVRLAHSSAVQLEAFANASCLRGAVS